MIDKITHATILVAKYNRMKDEVTEFSASSCLTLLYSINFCLVITTEGLGNTQDGFHAVQKRMSGFHASQCRFCTPSMCMSIFTSLINADKSKRPEPPNGVSKLTVSEQKRLSQATCVDALVIVQLLMPEKVLHQMLTRRIWA